MRIVRWDPADPAALRACHEVYQAAQQADDPFGPPKTARALRAWLKGGFEDNPCEVWFAPGAADGTADGWYWMELPDRENLDRAELILTVHPRARGGRIERELLRHAGQRGRANGRTVLSFAVRQGSSVDAFLRAAGARQGMTEIRRVLDLRKAPPGHFTALRETAARAADGYSLVSWTGVTPAGHLDGVAALLNAMNDAPHPDGVQDAVWDAERVRERGDCTLRGTGIRGYSVAATHDASGEMAGLTQLEVDPQIPEWGHQGLTAVTRPHRGHRLGLLIKAAMLEWLAEAEPDMERIDTGNADSNRFMIAVNEALGFEILDPPWTWLELPVAVALR